MDLQPGRGFSGPPASAQFIHPRKQIGGLRGLPALCVLLHRPLAIFALTCASAVRSITTRFLIVTTLQRDHPVVFGSLPFSCSKTSTAFISVGRLTRPFNHISAAMVLTIRSTGSTAFVRIDSLISAAMALTTRSTGTSLPCLCRETSDVYGASESGVTATKREERTEIFLWVEKSSRGDLILLRGKTSRLYTSLISKKRIQMRLREAKAENRQS